MTISTFSIYLKDCQDASEFNADKTILSSKTNGQLGNQMSAFATLYGISKECKGKLRVGLNFKQFEILSSAFPFFKRHFKEYLMDSWYCGLRASDMDQFKLKMHKSTTPDNILSTYKTLSKDSSSGYLAVLPPYLNIPKIYYQYYQELKSIFQLNEKIRKLSKEIINKTSINIPKVSAIIGVHVRSNDYKKHLKDMNATTIGPKYYQKAISHFRQLYENPLFLVVSDDKEAAIKRVIMPQQLSKYVIVIFMKCIHSVFFIFQRCPYQQTKRIYILLDKLVQVV